MTTIHGKEKWLDHSGTRICYEHFPSSTPKPAIVFVHGFLSSKFCYRYMIPELTKHYEVFAFDYPPFGNSDKVRTYQFSYRNFAAIIVELLNKHSIHRAYVAGHSMGGQIALLCAHMYPERIEKLILFAPSTYIKKAGFWFHAMSYLPAFPIMLKRFLHKRGVYDSLLDCVYDAQMINKEMIKGYMQPFLKDDIFHCLAKMIRDREGDLNSDLLRKIKTDCLVFWGKEDKVLPVSLGYRLVQDLPSATLQTFEKIGHLLPEEIPQTLTEQMIVFCSLNKQATS
ncbi:hypothetical protein N781_07520 [Pontibacillus halophilus JSM 076056 = DSM 19796]|uniref:AB hydrolase-1 domain-containing protein n=1 Tax=Pontibacillus halophilus JSM 076056 = DSM 19796 TaxID=1385510 RepID=A0A0A5I166_9BACI|nr:alpha/beta hydrolase [Pontibacillus halophilus]KGX89602.1 hypothetical protein N781_07520 [Pontibacillus halophilus JSM 076056 = DSM 19796]